MRIRSWPALSETAPAAPARAPAWRLVGALAVGAGLGFALLTFAFAPARVVGDSMLPTLVDGDVVLLIRPPLDRLLGRGAGPRAGDVVAATSPRDAGAVIVKRVAAVAGQVVAIVDGVVLADGAEVAWGDPDLAGDASFQPVTVAEGHVYLLGDNRLPLASRDSRSFGPLPLSALRGRVLLNLSAPPARR